MQQKVKKNVQWNALHNCIGTINLWFHFTGWKPSEAVRQITCRQNSAASAYLYPAVLLPRLITCRQKFGCVCLPLSSRSSATAEIRQESRLEPFSSDVAAVNRGTRHKP
ncbi:hypothetical protein J2T17_003127 [Paenibacillus mucilaginosus]|uniref:hypothetical protein n=1 Tax=Paenibacillus mucilaginosus TaxID=61624 RepID=UPI003D24D2B9